MVLVQLSTCYRVKFVFQKSRVTERGKKRVDGIRAKKLWRENERGGRTFKRVFCNVKPAQQHPKKAIGFFSSSLRWDEIERKFNLATSKSQGIWGTKRLSKNRSRSPRHMAKRYAIGFWKPSLSLDAQSRLRHFRLPNPSCEGVGHGEREMSGIFLKVRFLLLYFSATDARELFFPPSHLLFFRDWISLCYSKLSSSKEWVLSRFCHRD